MALEVDTGLCKYGGRDGGADADLEERENMTPLEIEVKFSVADVPSLRKQILDLGAISSGRHFEVNVRFDDAARQLRRNGSLLRLRQEDHTTLTFKSTPDRKDRQFKVHKELEVQVSDFNTMEQILHSLGFQRRQVYEKWRETFRLQKTLLCLDQMPFGDYLEIEGSRTAIRDVASRLALPWRRRILRNYLDMFFILKDRLQLPFSDVTFENFADVRLDINSDELFI